MATDYSKEMIAEFESIQSINDLCKSWAKIKPILAAAQAVLTFFLPPAAAAIGAIIALFDKTCSGKQFEGAGRSKAQALRKMHWEMMSAWKASAGAGETPCEARCREQYEQEVAQCGDDDLDCVAKAFGRYVICAMNCRRA